MLRFLVASLALILTFAVQSHAAVVLDSSIYSLNATVAFTSDSDFDSGFTGPFAADAQALALPDAATASVAGSIGIVAGDLTDITVDGLADTRSTFLPANAFSVFEAMFTVSGSAAAFTLVPLFEADGSSTASAKFLTGGSPVVTLVSGDIATGTLNPGTYTLRLELNSSGDGRATGTLTLLITPGDAPVIPLPAAAWSGLALLGSLTLRRRRNAH